MQCRGQVEGGVAQALGAALYEELRDRWTGRVVNPTFRNYHIPAFADIPRTEVLFRRDQRRARPLRRQVDEREPVQSGRGRARQRDRDATGIRFYRSIQGRPGAAEARRSGEAGVIR